jgi:hypothetical protein
MCMHAVRAAGIHVKISFCIVVWGLLHTACKHIQGRDSSCTYQKLYVATYQTKHVSTAYLLYLQSL